MKRKILTILMSLALVFTMMPVMTFHAYADDDVVDKHDPYKHANVSHITQGYGPNTIILHCEYDETDLFGGHHICQFNDWPVIVMSRPDDYYDGKPKEAYFNVNYMRDWNIPSTEGFPYDYAEWDGKFIYTGVNGTVEYGPTDKAPIGEGTYYVYAKVKIPSAKTLTSDGTFILGKQFTIEPSSYNVTFDANPPNNASTTPKGAMPELHFKSRVEKRDLPPNQFVLPGYTFDHWNTKPDDSGERYSNGEVNVGDLSYAGKTVTLYARWKPKTYKITYHSGAAGNDDVTEEVSFDQPGKLKSLSDLGFTYEYHGFLGWATDGFGMILDDEENYVNLCGAPSGYYNDPQDVELTAQWVGQGQIIVALTKDGEPIQDMEGHFYLEQEGGTRFTMPTKYENGRYVFDPSAAQQLGGQPAALPPGDYNLAFEDPGYETYSQLIKYSEDTAVTAVFDYYTVSAEKDPAYSDKITSLVLSGGVPLFENTFVVSDGRKMFLKAQVAPGYHFDGYSATGTAPVWEDNDPTKADQIIEVQGQAAIMAHVEANTYKVHFDANTNAAVIGKMKDQDMVYDEPQKLFANEFMCNGAEFTGWNTKKDGSGKQYADKASVKNLTDANGGKVTLYAQWKNKPTKTALLTFDLNGGTLNGKKGSITIRETVGNEIKMPAAPTRKGYTFKYWKGSNYKPGSKYKVTGDHKFTAVWQTKAGDDLFLKATAKGKTALTYEWDKVKGADGYDIFFAQCNHNEKKTSCKKAKTIKGNKSFKWTKSGLKKGTSYKAYIKAYVMKDGKKKYIKKSPIMHAYTGNGTKKCTNAKSVSVNKAKVSLKKGKTFKIKAKVKKVKNDKKLMPKDHVPTLRYRTSNSKVATVSKKGKIKAKGKGTCIVYVFAHNGVYKKVKVTVK